MTKATKDPKKSALSTRRPSKVYPVSAIRRLALHAQGLDAPSSAPPTHQAIYETIERILCLQIDTLHLVQRSQYLVLWSRLGTYTPTMLDQVAFGDREQSLEQRERRLFEYWLKEACFIPFTEYRYCLHRMRGYREADSAWWARWLSDPETQATLAHVRDRINREGGLRSADFEHRRTQPGGWWNWKPAKRALEHLYNTGDLMIADRVNFQRVYDLRERVMPAWVDTTEPPLEEAYRYLLTRAVKALGVCNPAQVAPYVRLSRSASKPVIESLIREKVFARIQAEQVDGNTRELIVHRDWLPALEKAADSALPARHTTFLSPFDNLFWSPGRDQAFWGFQQVLEAYKPEPIRKWGYFCLPVLHGERLVGRFDPKLERKIGLLRLKALYLEPGIEPDDALIEGVGAAMRDFMKFHGAKDLEISRSEPAEFGAKLLKAL